MNAAGPGGGEPRPVSAGVELAGCVVLREERDGYALLVDPDVPRSFVLNPVGLFICRGLDGTRSVPQIAAAVRDAFNGAPDEAGEQVQAFVDELVERGLAGAAAAGKET